MKRSFRRARKSYRPRKAKRYFKSRISRARRYNRPDLGYSEKVTFSRPVPVDANGVDVWFNAHWMATGNSGAHDVYFNDQTQFQQLVPLWKEYKITGLSIRYIPQMFFIGNSNITMTPISSGTLMDRMLPTPVGDPELSQSLDYKLFKAGNPFQRFYKVMKYARSKDIGWRETATALANGYNAIPDCTSSQICATSGMNAGDAIGRVDITWYIKFKTRVK